MEWQLAGAELVQSDPHELQGVGVHDVEAAASIHEHLGEAVVADDGVDYERIPPRMQDVVGVGWRGLGVTAQVFKILSRRN